MPEEIHNQYLNGGRAEKAKLLKMFVDSGLDKALGSKAKTGPFWVSFSKKRANHLLYVFDCPMFTLLRLFEKLL